MKKIAQWLRSVREWMSVFTHIPNSYADVLVTARKRFLESNRKRGETLDDVSRRLSIERRADAIYQKIRLQQPEEILISAETRDDLVKLVSDKGKEYTHKAHVPVEISGRHYIRVRLLNSKIEQDWELAHIQAQLDYEKTTQH